MLEYRVSTNFVKRFHNYLSSKEYKFIPEYAKSEYWKYHSDAIEISISGNNITMDGKSGFYIPPRKDPKKRAKSNFVKLIKRPSKLLPFIAKRIWYSRVTRIIDYFDAFDKVMNHDPITAPDLSPYRINFKKLKESPGIIVSISDMREKFFAKDKYILSPAFVASYYHYNILHGFIDLNSIKTILEIGG